MMKSIVNKESTAKQQEKSNQDNKALSTAAKPMGLAEKMVRHYKVAGKLRSFGSYNH